MAELAFHSMPDSAYLWTAMHVADEKSVCYEFFPLTYRSPEHLRLHPFGKMPVLQHGDTFLYETLAITHYIDTAFDFIRDSCHYPLHRYSVRRTRIAAAKSSRAGAHAALGQHHQRIRLSDDESIYQRAIGPAGVGIRAGPGVHRVSQRTIGASDAPDR